MRPTWEIASVGRHGVTTDIEKLARLLADGWEPYAVTEQAHHLRRLITPPPGPRAPRMRQRLES
jgi:hypothetical protein